MFMLNNLHIRGSILKMNKIFVVALVIILFQIHASSFQHFSRLSYNLINKTNTLNNSKYFLNFTNEIKKRCDPLFAKIRTETNKKKVKKYITITNSLIFVNVVMFFLSSRNSYLQNQLMKINYKVRRGELYRLVTSIFMHGSISHLFMNSFSLYQIGPNVESIFGTKRYLFLYLFSGILANCLTVFLKTSPYSLGASGSIFGLLGATGAFYYTNRKTFRSASDHALDSIKRTVLINMIYGGMSSGIDHWAHAGGFIVGGLLGGGIGPRYSLKKVPANRFGRGGMMLQREEFGWLSRLFSNVKKRFGKIGKGSSNNNNNRGLEFEYGDLSED